MFERLWEYLSRHIKIAWKSVFFNFKQYCCFFAAIFIVQLLFGMMFISSTNNNSVAKQQIQDEYDYHYALYDLTQSQYNYIKEYKRSDGMGVMDETKQLYVIVDETSRINVREQKEEYDVFLRFGKLDRETGAMASDDIVNKYRNDFEKFYVQKLASLEPSYDYQNFTTENTLLFTYSDRVVSNNATLWVIVVILLVLSVFLLTSIYNIRLNQYKFTYGVYMTFGADFKMLFVTAFWEMFVISLVTLIPAVLSSTLIVYLIYRPSGFAFSFNGWVVFFDFLFSTLVVLASVFLPMRTTSMRRPMSLIITEDNSNLVTSPRKSFNLLGKSFPRDYEMYSIWRFRKYNIQLLTTAIVFCALFICGLYLGDIYNKGMNYPRPQYQMTINTENTDAAYDTLLSEDIHNINDSFRKEYKDELEKFGWDNSDEAHTFNIIESLEATGNATPVDGDVDFAQSPSTEAKYISSFALVNKKNVKFLATGPFMFDQDNAYSKYDKKNSYKVTNDVLYKAVDPENPDDLFEFLSRYKIDGDVEKILDTSENYCIIGDSISNISKFNFKVGDQIALSTYEGAVTAVDSNLTGKNLLRKQIQNFKYNYTTLTICAVIKDIPSGSLPVYMLNDVYEVVTARSSQVTSLNVYTFSPDPADKEQFQLTNEMTTFVENKLRELVAGDGYSKVGSMVVTDLNQFAEKRITSDEHYNELLAAISVLILCISPIIWFFSQTLYYFKREKEFNVIQSLGANGADIRKIYLIGGLSMAVMSLIVSIILSYLGSYIMFYVVNVVVPSFSGEYVRYTFYMPWYALVISIVMSVACGFFSAYIPYKSYFKNRYSLENGGSGVQDDE